MRALVRVPMVQNGLLERLGGSLEVLREGLWRSSEGAWVSWDDLERSCEGYVCT